MTENPYRQLDDPSPSEVDDVPDIYAAPPRRGMSTGAKVAIGCAAATLLAVLALAVAIWFAISSLKGFASDLTTGAITQAIRDSDIPDGQKKRIVARLARLNEDYKAGRVTTEQIGAILESLSVTPLVLAELLVIDADYLQPSKLDDAEKAAGRRTLERVGRGVVDKTIGPEIIDLALRSLAEFDPADPSIRVRKETVSDDALRAVLAELNERANAAKVPDEAWDLNVAVQIDSIIDKVMADS